MIESKFSTPVTYKSNFSTEELTPYQVRVEVSGTERTSLFRLYIDGNLANWKVYKSFVFKGVCSTSGTRELLFSIPIINTSKCFLGPISTGTITVVEFEATYRDCEYKKWKGVSLPHSWVSYPTSRPTSKEGKLLESINPYDLFHIWDVGRELGRHCVEYHTARTLQDMGVSIKDMNWGRLSNVVKHD
jgi:hypothetical protein